MHHYLRNGCSGWGEVYVLLRKGVTGCKLKSCSIVCVGMAGQVECNLTDSGCNQCAFGSSALDLVAWKLFNSCLANMHRQAGGEIGSTCDSASPVIAVYKGMGTLRELMTPFI